MKGDITGKVVDDGEPVAGATVTIEGLEKGTHTNSEGYFYFHGIETGDYELAVTFVGYNSQVKKIRVEPDTDTRTIIELQRASEQLGEVVVTGTMRNTYVKESPVKVSVVKSEKLQQGRVSSNMMDLISSVNGLSSQLNCGVCGTNAIRINGVEGANTAVLIDGMPVMGALASVYGLNGISPSIIDQVEVIKGPQSTLYGTRALGGVVNIITKNPALTPKLSANVYAKSTEEGSMDIAYSPSSDRFEGFLSGNAVFLDNFIDNNNDNFNDLVRQSRVSLFAKGVMRGYQQEQRLNIAAKVYSENRNGGLQNFRNSLRGSGSIYGESIYTNRVELMGEYRPAGLNERLRISGAATYHDQDSFYGTEEYNAQQNIYFSQITWDAVISESHRLLAGSTIRYEVYNDNTPATSAGADKRSIPGMFAQSESRLGSSVILGGLRVDHHSEHGLITSPRLSVKLQPAYNTSVRLSAGTGFRVVNVFTEDHAALTGAREVVFAEDLLPERSRSATAGLEQIFSFGTNPLTLGIDAFYTHFSNKIIPDYDQDPSQIVYKNLNGYSVTRGTSVDIEQNFTSFPLTYSASFTLMDVFTEEDGNREPVDYAPDFTGNFSLTYNVRQNGITVGYSGNLTGPKKMPKSVSEPFNRKEWSPTHFVHDIKITKEFMNVNGPGGIGFETYVSVENILNFTQGSPIVSGSNPFGADFDTIYTWGPILGRTLTIGARINLR